MPSHGPDARRSPDGLPLAIGGCALAGLARSGSSGIRRRTQSPLPPEAAAARAPSGRSPWSERVPADGDKADW